MIADGELRAHGPLEQVLGGDDGPATTVRAQDPVRLIAALRRACLRSSSAQIFAARASVEGQRRVYAPGVTSPLSYARTTA